jgi:hypothetical protein
LKKFNDSDPPPFHVVIMIILVYLRAQLNSQGPITNLILGVSILLRATTRIATQKHETDRKQHLPPLQDKIYNQTQHPQPNL